MWKGKWNKHVAIREKTQNVRGRTSCCLKNTKLLLTVIIQKRCKSLAGDKKGRSRILFAKIVKPRFFLFCFRKCGIKFWFPLMCMLNQRVYWWISLLHRHEGSSSLQLPPKPLLILDELGSSKRVVLSSFCWFEKWSNFCNHSILQAPGQYVLCKDSWTKIKKHPESFSPAGWFVIL